MKFMVKVERTLVQSTFVEVEAANDEKAGDIAVSQVEDSPSSCDWELEGESFEAVECEECDREEEEDAE